MCRGFVGTTSNLSNPRVVVVMLYCPQDVAVVWTDRERSNFERHAENCEVSKVESILEKYYLSAQCTYAAIMYE